MREEQVARYPAMAGQAPYYMSSVDLKHKIPAIPEEEGASLRWTCGSLGAPGAPNQRSSLGRERGPAPINGGGSELEANIWHNLSGNAEARCGNRGAGSGRQFP